MNAKFALIAALLATLGLSACGGGSDAPAPAPAASPAALVKTDIVLGTGAQASAGKAVTVHYTGWLYSTSTTDFKGTQFDSSIGKAPFGFTVGAGQVIAGFDQGVSGMKVGGKRTVLIPGSLGYGASGGGGGKIPPNAGLVFDIELIEVK